jgi:hypothetical protein
MRDIIHGDRDRSGEIFDAGVTGGDIDAGNAFGLVKLPRERVFTATTANN